MYVCVQECAHAQAPHANRIAAQNVHVEGRKRTDALLLLPIYTCSSFLLWLCTIKSSQ